MISFAIRVVELAHETWKILPRYLGNFINKLSNKLQHLDFSYVFLSCISFLYKYQMKETESSFMKRFI